MHLHTYVHYIINTSNMYLRSSSNITTSALCLLPTITPHDKDASTILSRKFSVLSNMLSSFIVILNGTLSAPPETTTCV